MAIFLEDNLLEELDDSFNQLSSTEKLKKKKNNKKGTVKRFPDQIADAIANLLLRVLANDLLKQSVRCLGTALGWEHIVELELRLLLMLRFCL